MKFSCIQVYAFTLHDVQFMLTEFDSCILASTMGASEACTSQTGSTDEYHKYFMRNCWGLRGDFRDCQVQTKT